MIDMELDLLRENPSWLVVLRAYETVFEELAAANPPDTDESADETASANDDATQEAEDTGTSASVAAASRRPRPWAPRLTAVEGVNPEELSRIHGRLIAYGLLKCDLADRSSGVVYQLTSEARKSLEALADRDLAANTGNSIEGSDVSIPA